LGDGVDGSRSRNPGAKNLVAMAPTQSCRPPLRPSSSSLDASDAVRYLAIMKDGIASTGAVALVAGGIASAFALATCCAFPILFGSAAFALAPIALATEPHSQLLTAISAIGLVGSVGVAAGASRRCKPNAVCARPWFRFSIIAAALLGAVLLVAAKYYA